MNEREAKFTLENPDEKKFSEIGEAIDVLLSQHSENRKRVGYKKLSETIGIKKVKRSGCRRSFTLSDLHRIYKKLPPGILWKIDRGEIDIAHGVHIARLKNEEEQWVLALAINVNKLSRKECKRVVSLVIQKPKSGEEKAYSIREALDTVAGICFENIPRVMEILSPEEWIAVSKEAWNRKMNWEDFFHRLATEKHDVLLQVEKVADQLRQRYQELSQRIEEIAAQLKSLEDIAGQLWRLAKQLRKLAAFGESADYVDQKTEAEKGASAESGGGKPGVKSKRRKPSTKGQKHDMPASA